MNSPQIKILAMRLANNSEPHDPVNFVKRAGMSRDQMEEYIDQTILKSPMQPITGCSVIAFKACRCILHISGC